MKTVYFVRHGESESNAGDSSYKGKNGSSLTDKGRSQAEEVAGRCEKLPIDVIFASTMNRAQETAQIIAKRLNKDFETFPFLVERRRASGQIGKPNDDPETIKIEREIEANFATPGWRHSDEENFDDLKGRALKILEFLESRPEQNILVIAHGYFLRIIMACVVIGPEVSAFEVLRFAKALRTKNTGITVLNFNPEDKESVWKLLVWNDHAHLG